MHEAQRNLAMLNKEIDYLNRLWVVREADEQKKGKARINRFKTKVEST